MTALIIIAAVIIIFVLLLNMPAYAHIKFYGGKPEITVKYLWLTLFPKAEKGGEDTEKKREEKSPDKPPPDKSPSKAEKKETAKKAESEPSDKQEKSTDKKTDKASVKDGKKKKNRKKQKQPLADRINSVVDDLTEKKDAFLLLWELCSGHLKNLAGKIYVSDLIIDFAAANEDAADAALLYGKLNIAVYDTLSVLMSFMTVKISSVTIDCLFGTPAEKTRYDGECKVKLRPASLVNAVMAIIFGYIGDMKKYSPALNVFTKKSASR